MVAFFVVSHSLFYRVKTVKVEESGKREKIGVQSKRNALTEEKSRKRTLKQRVWKNSIQRNKKRGFASNTLLDRATP